MRFLRQSLTGLVLVSMTLALLVWAGTMVRDAVEIRMAEESVTRPARERVFAVNVVPVTFGTEVPMLTAFGEVQSRRTLELRAATGGTVIALDPAFVEGGQVASGALLARIDPAEAEAALARAVSDVADAEAEVREADRALLLARDELVAAQDQVDLRVRAHRRQQDLADRGVGTAAAEEVTDMAQATARGQLLATRQSLAQAEARINSAATSLTRARIARDEAARHLADTEITAPFTGTLSDVSVVGGRLVAANEQLAQLVDPAALEVAFRVSTQQYTRLLDDNGVMLRAPVSATLDVFGTDLVATGTLTRESAAVGEGQTGRLLFATLDDAPGFKPGDFVTVTVREAPLPRVARLPASALNAASEVLVIAEDNRLQTRPVELLRRQGNDVLVRGRALEGAEVVAERTPLLGDGIRVNPLRNTDAPPKAPEMLELSEERRARLVAFVEANQRMPAEAKTRILGQLAKNPVPAPVVERIESRMGG